MFRKADDMRLRKRILGMMMLFCMGSLVAGCGKGKVRMASAEIVFTGTLSENEVFRVEEEICTLGQAKLFLVNEKNQYEGSFGSELWQQELDGQTFEDYIRNMVQNQLAQMKAMVLLARRERVDLDEEEKELAKKAAEAYFSSLTQEEITILQVTEGEVRQIYEDYCLAGKIYQKLTSQVEQEISDSEARVIVVQHILFQAKEAEQDPEAIRRRLLEIKRRVEEGSSFSSLAAEYSEDPTIEYSFGRGEMEGAFEEAAFALSVGEVSDVVETSSGYHLIYCVNDYDVEKTTNNKATIMERWKQAAFDQVYQKFAAGLVSEMNEKAWNRIRFEELTPVTTQSLFSVYTEYWKK